MLYRGLGGIAVNRLSMDELQVKGKFQLDCEEGLNRSCQNYAFSIMIQLTKSMDTAQ